jgi:hypothetical protein
MLVPQFLSRCILDTISRVALPVEYWTPRTRAVLVVHQFGFRQRLEDIAAEAASRSVPYVEDSPFGFEPQERLGPGALARFLGFSKVLPILKGGFALTTDERLAQFFRVKRDRSSLWSWPLLGMLAALRRSRYAAESAVAADLAYELYVESQGDNGWFRGNIRAGLDRIRAWEATVAARLKVLSSELGARVAIPDSCRLAPIVPYFVEDRHAAAGQIFARHGFNPSTYHIDVNRNLLAPAYRKACLIPVHPRIPQSAFEPLIVALRQLT